MALPDELANLPPPELIEELDYDTRLGLFVTKLLADMQAVGIAYDVNEMESDPAKVLLRVATYIDINLRDRVNQAMRANLLPFAYGGDLDILAQFYDVTRMFGETDDALRARVVLAIRGRSTGGTEPRYRFIAVSADVNVADAAIYTVGKSPVVHVAVFSKINGGVADAPMLAAVEAALMAPAVRMVNDTINVHPAVRKVVNITADVWLLPSASNTILDSMEIALRAAWVKDGALGRDLTRSYVSGKLMLDGVQDVEPTMTTAVAAFNEAIAIGTVTLNNRGRKY